MFVSFLFLLLFFFFKQKTAYELRMSDWSSDVCSSDLDFIMIRASLWRAEQAGRLHHQHNGHDDEDDGVGGFRIEYLGQALDDTEGKAGDDGAENGAHAADDENGRASGRARGWK